MRRLSILAVFVPGFCLAQTPPAQSDRSAEPRLRQVFAAMGKLKSVHAEIGVVSRDDSKLPFYPICRIALQWRSDGAFRMDYTGGWGDGQSFASDGSNLLIDYMDITAGAVMRDAKPHIFENDSELDVQGGLSSPLYFFLAGDMGMEKLVAKDGEIVSIAGEGSEEGIRFKSAKWGTMAIFFDPKDKNLLLRRCAFDNLEYKTNLADRLAEYGFTKPIDPMDVHTIKYFSVNKGLAKDAFSTVLPKGLRLQDQRAKKPGAGAKAT